MKRHERDALNYCRFFAVRGALSLMAAGFAAAPLGCKKAEPAATQAATEPAPAEEATPPAGHVKLTAEQVDNAKITTEAIPAATFAPVQVLYGVIQEDPAASFTVRTESAGIIKAGANRAWPGLGEALADNTEIGTVEPRLVPADLLALASQRTALLTQQASAQADVTAATVSLDEAQKERDRAKTLNAQDKLVSDRALEEAEARVKTEESHLAGAKQSLDLATAALKTLQLQQEPMPLKTKEGGEVVDVSVHPGEAVESGQEVLRVSRFDHVLAAIDVPASESISADAKEARIVPMGRAKPLAGARLGTAAQIDPKTKNQVILFRAAVGDEPVRPGTPVTAYIAAGGEPLKGYNIPRTAVVRYQGKAWVYVAGKDKNSFDRWEVSLDNPLPDASGWFVNQGFKGEEQLVTTGAAVLLSTELNALGGGGD